jgi:hypothetical protein
VSLLLLLAPSGEPVRAASAVAVGVGSDRQIRWGWAAGDDLEHTKRRAMEFCKASGGLHPRIIVYTPTRGYGAIVIYKEAGNGINVTASVGDSSERQAINGALKKAKMAGGHTPKLWRTWHDFAPGEMNF